MNCASITPLLDAWLDRELSSEVRSQVDQHLSICPQCQSAIEELRRLDQQLRDELPPSSDEVKRLIDSTLAALQPGMAAG